MASIACPECHSTKLTKFGKRWVKASSNTHRIQKQQYLCGHCGRITINPVLAQSRNAQGRFSKAIPTSTTPEPLDSPVN